MRLDFQGCRAQSQTQEKERINTMSTLFLSDDGLKAFDEMTIQDFDAGSDLESLVQPTSNGEAIGYTEVGFAKPITIHIERVYTGKYPKLGWSTKSKDMLITTAYKSENFVGASPRSFNWIQKGIDDTKKSFTGVKATQEGTNLVYAKPAIDKDSIILTIDFSFDDFGDKLLDIFSQIFSAAGKIPAFAAYSPYFLVAGKLVSLGKEIGNRIFDSEPEISLDARLYFRRAGKIPVKEGRIAVVAEEFSPVVRNTYTIGEDDLLVSKNSHEVYKGNQPYVILSLDGRPLSRELQNFSPTLASAAQLKRFLAIKEGKETDVDFIIEALNLYNDYQIRMEAERLKRLLEQQDLADNDRQRIQDELNAKTQNIINEVLRPTE
jgi:hypothetical protein